MAHDIFVSYARENADAANAIVDLLQDMGISCWIDNQTIAHQHGEEWADEIVSAIAASRLMIVVFSQHANASKYVKSEVHKAFDSDVPIIPFRVEDVAPQGSLALHLASSQWLDAFPLFEKHLNTLATSVCRLLDAPGKKPDATDRDRSPKIGWRRFITGHIEHLRRSGASRTTAGKTRTAPAAPDLTPADYGSRKAAHEAASKEDLRVLAKANQWWRIHEIIDALETQGVPLGRYAEAKAPLEKRMAAFQRARHAAEEALTRLGPAKSEPQLLKLQEVVADHPDIEALNTRRKAMLRDRVHLQKTLDSLVNTNRWTAVENTIRAFVLKHGQATQSLLTAAEKASARALEESRRLDLFMWTIFSGAVMLGACYCVESWLGISDGSFANNYSDTTNHLLVPFVSVFIRFGTAVTAAGFMLAVFGLRHQGTFAGASIGLMIVAAAAQSLPWACSLIPWGNMSPPRVLDIALSGLPGAVFAAALMTAFHFSTSLLIGVRPGGPGLTASIAAALAGYGFLPERGMTGSYLSQLGWTRWMPDAILCASVLATAGAVSRKRWWWLLPLVAMGAGLLGPSSSWSTYDPLLKRTGPVIIGLLVAGWIAVRPNTVRGYLVLLAAACGSCLAAEYLRGVDARSGMLSCGRLGPLLAIWAIACGSVAIRHKGALSPWVRGWDTLVKQVLRIRGAGHKFHDRQLAESAWFHEGRKWHTIQAPAGESSKKTPRTG